jgi:hypothetical protein
VYDLESRHFQKLFLLKIWNLTFLVLVKNPVITREVKSRDEIISPMKQNKIGQKYDSSKTNLGYIFAHSMG